MNIWPAQISSDDWSDEYLKQMYKSIATASGPIRQDSWSPTNWSSVHMHIFFEFLKMPEVFQSLNHLLSIQKKY